MIGLIQNLARCVEVSVLYRRKMIVDVIVCTYNRHESLAKALESVAVSVLPDSIEWDVLVVDNNSTDQTRDVVEGLCRRYPGKFRYKFEGRPGKSHALNAGIREARGDVVAFMDDDVTVDCNWLHNLTASLNGHEWAGAGGRILPRWEASPPSWLASGGRYRSAPLALFDLGPDAGQLAEPPFGTNMAFRKAMFQKYGGFRTDLGPNPENLIRGEDTEFGSRLLKAGERLVYEPAAIVHHPVAPGRIQKQYFLAWWFDKGRADIRQHGVEATRSRCCGIPLVFFRRFLSWVFRWSVAVRPDLRFESKIKVWYNAGMITECYRRARCY